MRIKSILMGIFLLVLVSCSGSKDDGGTGAKPTEEWSAVVVTAGSVHWTGITSSSNGTKLAAVVGGIGGGFIYTSTDSGATWTARATDETRNWFGITSSSDGTKLAAVDHGGYIYTSTDSGATWEQRTSAGSRN